MLDVGGMDVVAAPDDHVLAPADDVEVPVVVQPAQVSGDQPPVPPRLRCRLGVLEVLPVAPGEMQPHLSYLVGRQRFVVRSHNPHLGRRVRSCPPTRGA